MADRNGPAGPADAVGTAGPGVRAAVVGPFSGPRAAWGELLERGAAAHDSVDWDLHDDRGETAVSRSVAEAVVADGRYALVIGHFNSAGARTALPVYRAAGIPVLLPLATAPGLLAGTTGAALRWCPDDLAQLAELRAAVLRAGHTVVALADDGSAYGSLLGQLLLVLPEDGLEVGGPGAGIAADATALIVCGTHAGAARAARSHRDAGFTGALYFTDDCAVEEFAELLGEAAGEAYVARLQGGAAAQVDSAFATVATVLAAAQAKAQATAPDAAKATAPATAPALDGPAVLDALRAHADREFTPEGEPVAGRGGAGWEVVPVPAPNALPASTPDEPAAEEHQGKAYDVLVIGAGVVGAATADVLARQGLRVAMTAPSVADPAATAESGGLVRAYDPDPVIRALALRSHHLAWGREPGPDTPPTGFECTGSLVLLGEEDLAEAEKGVAELTGEGVEATLLTPEELRELYPALDVSDVAGAVWEPGAGYADPPTVARGYRDRACAHGAVVLSGRVVRLERRETDRVHVVLEESEVTARAVVLAAGTGTPYIQGHSLSADVPDGPAAPAGRGPDAWQTLEPLPGTDGPPTAAPRTKAIRYGFFEHPDSQSLPSVIDLVTGVWGRPQYTGPAADGYLVGRPVDEWDVAPDGGPGITEEQAEHIRSGTTHRWPWLADAQYLLGRHGVDLYTRDGRPILGPESEDSRIVFAAGWSGSGFKTAPAAAEQVAAHVRDMLGPQPLDEQPLGPEALG